MTTQLTNEERTKLLHQRDQLIDEIKALSSQPLSRSEAAKRGRQEDLTTLAKKVTAIDKKLGRV